MNKFLADSAKMQKCVQYALVAEDSGFYVTCTGEKYYLNEQEVWKYGVTCEAVPANRYAAAYYKGKKLRFVPQFYGTKAECELEEKRKLFLYPILPENLARKPNFRLVLPPGNCQTR
jgi:hypothetical protein